MKKACSILLALVFLLVPAQAAFAQADAVRIDAGWDILVPAEPTSYETFAAEKLSQCLAEVFGAAPERKGVTEFVETMEVGETRVYSLSASKPVM